jgi:hypothetical protein
MKMKFAAALVCYGVLALLAAYTLEGMFRGLVLLFLLGLAAKTLIAKAAGWHE